MINTDQSLAAIRRTLRRHKVDAFLVAQPENRRYLSGYTACDTSINESSGVLLIPAKGEPFLFTDSRFDLQASAEAVGFTVQLYPRGLLATLDGLLPKLKVRRLAFESHYLLHATFQKLAKITDRHRIEMVPYTDLVEKLRVRKNSIELAKIEQSVLLNEEVFQEIYKGLRPGMSERQVAQAIENCMKEKGASGPSFETMVASGPNGALPHAVPSERQLRKGEPVVIDMGLILDGYCSDMTRTVALGTPDEKVVNLVRLVRKAQLAGTKAIRAGITGREVDRAAREVIVEGGFGKHFGHGLGHGVGLAVHEAPSLNKRYRKKLAAGMVVTVEPGIYLPDWGGIRLENMAVVTEQGSRLLNRDTTFLDI